MRIFITGGSGMLGRTLRRRWHSRHEIHAPSSAELDVGDAAAVSVAVDHIRPQTVVHCAAFTAVDRAESERETAFRINATGSANLAAACQRHGARLIAISTDYVFAGDLDRPYGESDATGPRTVYGASKLAGEEAVRAACADHLIARVAWLYGPGGPSFIHTMRRLAAGGEGRPLRVVDDQIGNPTSTDAVALALEPLLDARIAGTMHLTCAGETSWFGLCRRLFDRLGIDREVHPCRTSDHPRPAPRPANSRLAKDALARHGLPALPDWRDSLDRFLTEFPDG